MAALIFQLSGFESVLVTPSQHPQCEDGPGIQWYPEELGVVQFLLACFTALTPFVQQSKGKSVY